MFTPDLLNDIAVRAPSYRQWSEGCNNFREISVLDPESKDMYHCHPDHFFEISKLRLTSPSGPIRYSILTVIKVKQALLEFHDISQCKMAVTGLDRQSAHPFQLIIRKGTYCTAANSGVT